MVKQLGIPKYFLTLPCADLRWEELPYIIIKLNNLGLSEKKLKKSTQQERRDMLNNNPVFMPGISSIKLTYFSKKSYLMVHWEKQNITLYVLIFKKRGTHMSIRLYGFSMHQIFKIKLPTLSSLKKNNKYSIARPFESSRAF